MKSEQIKIEPPTMLSMNEAQGQLARALARLDDGKLWCQGSFVQDNRICAVTAICREIGMNAMNIDVTHPAVKALVAAASEAPIPIHPAYQRFREYAICGVNNAAPGDFAPVRQMFTRAIEIAGGA